MFQIGNAHYSLWQQMWINPPLKIVPNKCSAYFCLSALKLQWSANLGSYLAFLKNKTRYFSQVFKDVFRRNERTLAREPQTVREDWEMDKHFVGFGSFSNKNTEYKKQQLMNRRLGEERKDKDRKEQDNQWLLIINYSDTNCLFKHPHQVTSPNVDP